MDHKLSFCCKPSRIPCKATQQRFRISFSLAFPTQAQQSRQTFHETTPPCIHISICKTASVAASVCHLWTDIGLVLALYTTSLLSKYLSLLLYPFLFYYKILRFDYLLLLLLFLLFFPSNRSSKYSSGGLGMPGSSTHITEHFIMSSATVFLHLLPPCFHLATSLLMGSSSPTDFSLTALSFNSMVTTQLWALRIHGSKIRSSFSVSFFGENPSWAYPDCYTKTWFRPIIAHLKSAICGINTFNSDDH